MRDRRLMMSWFKLISPLRQQPARGTTRGATHLNCMFALFVNVNAASATCTEYCTSLYLARIAVQPSKMN